MDGYFDFLYRDHTIPYKYGQLSKHLAEGSGKYGGRVELTGEELAEEIEYLSLCGSQHELGGKLIYDLVWLFYRVDSSSDS